MTGAKRVARRRFDRGTLLALALLVAAILALVARPARGNDLAFAGSAQVDYFLVPTEGANVNQGTQNNGYGFDGLTLEASAKVAADISDHLSATIKVCFGCHGFEIDTTYIEYRFLDELTVRAGRFSPSFGSFNLRHDVGNHKLSDKPLPYDMGRMLRLHTWNLGVIPSPFPDTGVEIDGTHWFGDSTQLDYAVYAVQGFRSNAAHPLDIDFTLSHQFPQAYYIDNNGWPAGGARLALTVKMSQWADVTAGVSGMYGTYDPNNKFSYAIGGADLVFRLGRTALRFEYLVRRTEIDTSDPSLLALPVQPGDGKVIKHGAYAEVEQPIAPAFDVIARVDGLYRVGNYPFDPTGETFLSRDSWLLRGTLGMSWAVERGLRIKLSGEIYEFSDKDDDGHLRDVGMHLALVGTF